jgi:hypothetical protein
MKLDGFKKKIVNFISSSNEYHLKDNVSNTANKKNKNK